MQDMLPFNARKTNACHVFPCGQALLHLRLGENQGMKIHVAPFS
jgi:hypothetical protein